jgi:HK97 family phage major capsid protein
LIELPSTRDMTVAGVSGSAYLVGQSNPGGRFLESYLGASIAARLGVQTIDMGREDAAVPVVTTPATTVYLSDETTAISTSAPVIGSRLAKPKAVAALVTFTRQLLTMSSPNVQNLLMTEVGRAVAAAIDSALFNGSGVSGQPTGILATPGIVSASGGSIDLADVADMIEDVITAGAPMVSPGWAADGATLEILLTRARAANVGEMLATEANRLVGYPMQVSKNGPASALVFADWSNVYICRWGALELAVDGYTAFSTGKISLRAIAYFDTLVAHPGAIAVRTSVS